jgi:hypothetical protein
MAERVLVVRPSRSSFVLAPAVLVLALVAFDALVLGLLMLDPRWRGDGALAIFELLPNYMRSAIFVMLAGLIGFFCLGLVRLLASDRTAVLTRAGADVLTMCGWRHVAWNEVKKIEQTGGASLPAVRLVWESPDAPGLAFPQCPVKVRVGWMSNTSRTQILDFIAGVRPDLAPDNARADMAGVGRTP